MYVYLILALVNANIRKVLMNICVQAFLFLLKKTIIHTEIDKCKFLNC